MKGTTVSGSSLGLVMKIQADCFENGSCLTERVVTKTCEQAQPESAERKTSQENAIVSGSAPFKLHSVGDIPAYLQYNKFILTGYRCNLNTQDCIHSLLYWHNETLNIYTHGIPFFGVLIFLPFAFPVQSASFWFYIHYLACLSPFFASTIYHLFLCHHSGGQTYDRFLKFDLLGIWAINTFGGLCGIKAALFCYMQWVYFVMFLYVSIATFACYKVLCARTPKDRLIPLLTFGIMRYGTLTLRYLMSKNGMGGGDPTTASYFLLMDFVAFLGGLINVLRVPERWFPGKLDYILNSHQIMHVLVSISIYIFNMGTVLDLQWMETFQCPN